MQIISKFKESDMYAPIRDMLESQGFTVRGEVKGCDIAAVKDETLWIVEMKLTANLTLLYQAQDRKAATDWVFIAIPRPRISRGGNFAKLKKLLKALKIGLITVALDSPAKHAEIIFLPEGKQIKDTKKANQLKKEIKGRTIDSIGGTAKKTINTAYRERCIRIACILESAGPLRATDLVKTYGCESDAHSILRSNFQGWYIKVSRGLFNISPLGREFLEKNADSVLVAHYSPG